MYIFVYIGVYTYILHVCGWLPVSGENIFRFETLNKLGQDDLSVAVHVDKVDQVGENLKRENKIPEG